jgi:hypothetical protein
VSGEGIVMVAVVAASVLASGLLQPPANQFAD